MDTKEEMDHVDANYCHDRADHEDHLFVSRTNLFISVNGFFAIAVGLVKGNEILQIIFALMVLSLNIFWVFWAPRSRKFIHDLRGAGGARKDQKVWKESVGSNGKEDDTKFLSFRSPLFIISRVVPTVLALGWTAILLYFVWPK